jgi:hypothetical protein
MVAYACGSSNVGGIGERNVIQAGPGKTASPYLKNKK